MKLAHINNMHIQIYKFADTENNCDFIHKNFHASLKIKTDLESLKDFQKYDRAMHFLLKLFFKTIFSETTKYS